jgi:hypothetical protein
MSPKKNMSGDTADSVAELNRIIGKLEAENAMLKQQRDAYVKNAKVMKTKLEAKFKEIQAGVKERIDRGDSKSSIMEYLKAGFFTALGVIAAFLVVDVIASGIEELASDDEEPAADEGGEDDAGDGDAGDGDAGDGGFGDFAEFEFGGGRGQKNMNSRNKSTSGRSLVNQYRLGSRF